MSVISIYIDKLINNTFFIEVNGVRIRVYDSVYDDFKYDETTTLVFLHGSPGQISNWRHQLDYFKKLHRVIAYDQRGFGISDKPREVRFEDYISDLDVIFNHLKISNEDAILIGHSFGALVSQTYACDRRVKGLVLIGSLAWRRATLMDKFIWYMPSIFWHRLLFTDNKFSRKIYRKLFFSPNVGDYAFNQFIEDNKEYIGKLPVHILRCEKCYEGYDASENVDKIKCPTMIIVGEHDKVTPIKHSKKLHQLISNSKLSIVKDAGHMILYEQPDVLNKLIRQFISSL